VPLAKIAKLSLTTQKVSITHVFPLYFVKYINVKLLHSFDMFHAKFPEKLSLLRNFEIKFVLNELIQVKMMIVSQILLHIPHYQVLKFV
jgi:preprotein translocase subunit Sec63